MIRKLRKTIAFKLKSLEIHLKSILEKKRLKSLGLHSIKFLGWSPKYLRRYYSGISNNFKYFVKITDKDSASLNEVFVLSRLERYNLSFIPKIKLLSRDFHKSTILLIDYCSKIDFRSYFKEKDIFISFCNTVRNILDAFYKIGFVHGDVHKGNLLQGMDKTIKLIDYGIGTFVNEHQNIDYRTHYGTFFREFKNGSNTIRRYDDAYSFVQFIKSLNLPSEWLNQHSFKDLESLVGRLYFDVIL